MRTAIFYCLLCLALVRQGPAQSTFSFRNKTVNAPVFDSVGIPLAGTNYLVELYGDAAPNSLAPTVSLDTMQRVIISFLEGTNAGYFVTGRLMAVVNTPPGGSAWLQVRAWEARFGATYEDVAALGIGGYGESPLFYADGGDPTRLEAGGPLLGLQSFSLRAVVPEPSAAALLAVGGAAIWMVRRRPRALDRKNVL